VGNSTRPRYTRAPGVRNLTTGRAWLSLVLVGALATLAVPARAAASGGVPHQPDLDMIAAAGSGDVVEVKRLLDGGASVRFADARGTTALIAAAYGNHLWAARLLIEAGADVNAQDGTRQSAFLIATSEGYVDLLKLTIAAGADVRRTDAHDGTGLIRAVACGHVEIVRELLQTTDIAIDHANRRGWTALLEAIVSGNSGAPHTQVIRLLVAAGADVGRADAAGVTPLAHARRRGRTHIVEILERAGAR
jgi:uncharacterized protein